MPLQFPQHSISEAVAVHEVPQRNVFSLWTFRFDNLKKKSSQADAELPPYILMSSVEFMH